MKYSLRKQFPIIFISLMAGTILVCWFINNTLLEKYYIKNKEKVIQEAYEEIKLSAADNSISMEMLDEMRKVWVTYNISTMIIDVDYQVQMCVGAEQDVMKRALMDNIFESENKRERLKVYTGENGDYYVLQNVVDMKANTRYMEMWGSFENGNLFLLRSSVESIEESVGIANRFLSYVGIVAVLASAVIIWQISKKVTEPILELVSISERMIHLDFDAKYSGKSKTEVALLGENINKLSAALEGTISELKTANNELQKDIEKKNKVDEMRKEFLSNVSHELKTPIALIQGYAEGLREGINDDAESREFYCDVIMDEAAKMNNMVKKLMTLNELEFGNDNVSMERFNITALIQNYVHSAEILTNQNGVTVKMHRAEAIYVWADEFKTEEVFANYFTNAVNHCTGEKIIDVKLEQKEGRVRIGVFNTGEPIPEEAIPHLWEKFYKVDKARTREYGGSGVGLSIVKAIMESMNQEYGVENYANGVMFWFELETA